MNNYQCRLTGRYLDKI